jgi:mannose-6-phosphate isomerase-like protein (cupin superfamily)
MKYDSIVKYPESKILKCGRILLKPGEEVGEHVTDKKEEVIIVLKGSGVLIKENSETEIGCGNAYFIEEGKKHNIKNASDNDLEYVFVVATLKR